MFDLHTKCYKYLEYQEKHYHNSRKKKQRFPIQEEKLMSIQFQEKNQQISL